MKKLSNTEAQMKKSVAYKKTGSIVERLPKSLFTFENQKALWRLVIAISSYNWGKQTSLLQPMDQGMETRIRGFLAQAK